MGDVIHTASQGNPPRSSSSDMPSNSLDDSRANESIDLKRPEQPNELNSNQQSEKKSDPQENDSENGESGLSSYEKLRLERIKRNQAYLSQLGLEDATLKQPPKRKKKRRKSEPLPEGPTRSSGRSRKSIDYTEPSSSVAKLVNGRGVVLKPKRGRSLTQEAFNKRMDRNIYHEFRRLKAHKGHSVKQANKLLKGAEKEVSFWQRQKELWDKRNEKRLHRERIEQELQQERDSYGGLTLKQLLQEADSRMPELLSAMEQYDNYYQGAALRREREMKKAEEEETSKLLIAIDWFPKMFKRTRQALNALLRQSLPSDTPSSSRRTRSGIDDELQDGADEDDTNSDTESKKPGRPKKLISIAEELDAVRNTRRIEEDCMSDYAKASEGKETERSNSRWITSKFAQLVDRSWLSHDSPTTLEPDQYVPQVGDTVLYYMSGHKEFLDKYPDHNGQTTSRTPLWERVLKEDGPSKDNEQCWWNDTWKMGWEDDLGRYPLVCKVEKIHIEFPCDPFQISENSLERIRSDESTASAGMNVRTIKKVPLRLVVLLRPLSRVLPPIWQNEKPNTDELHEIALPPCFSAVIFPCELTPFIVPLGWAYASSHCLTLNSQVISQLGNGKRYTTKEVLSLNDSKYGSFGLSDKHEYIACMRRTFSTESALLAAFESESSGSEHTFQNRDVLTMFETICQVADNSGYDGFQQSSSAVDPCFHDFVLSTLPLWKSVNVVPVVNQRQQDSFSPWELIPVLSKRALVTAATIRKVPTLNRVLRDKVESIINSSLADDATASLFEHPVSDDDAPSYACAVPLSMSLSRIKQRVRSARGVDKCYYRTCEAVASDLGLIASNCLAYNNPESAVATAAVKLMNRLRLDLASMAQKHYNQFREAGTGNSVCTQVLDGSADGIRYPSMTSLRSPVKEIYSRTWLLGNKSWFPCSGDVIGYSRRLHEKFIDSHRSSFRVDQLEMIDTSSDWVHLFVCWTHVVFPKATTKKTATFRQNSVVLAIGLKRLSGDPKRISVIYWRPCVFDNDDNECCHCGLSQSTSFIRPCEPNESLEEGSTMPSLELVQTEVVDAYFGILRSQCLKGSALPEIDRNVTKENVKAGYRPIKKTKPLAFLPEHEHIELNFSHDTAEESTCLPARAPARKSFEDKQKVRRILNYRGYTPSWLTAALKSKDELLSKCSHIAPVPEFSLAMIHKKLRAGMYIHAVHLENEIIESFLTVAILGMFELAGGKKPVVSATRVCRLVSSAKTLDHFAEKYYDDEIILAERIRFIRDTYAAALLGVYHSAEVAALYGLKGATTLEATAINEEEDPPEDSSKVAARRKLDVFLRAIGRERYHTSSRLMRADSEFFPSVNVSIVAGDKVFTHPDQVVRIDTRPVVLREERKKVKVFCGGQHYPWFRDVNEEDTDEGKIVKMTKTCIMVEPHELATTASLQKAFFGRPGNTDVCARCRVYHRSFFACRVRRSHTNMDFDWASTFRGVGGIDGLIQAVLPPGSTPTTRPSPVVAKKDAEESVQLAQPSPHIEDSQPLGVEEELDQDPTESLLKAQQCLTRGRELVQQAISYAASPPILGKECIDTTFPIDPADGHLVYCVICGLSGDLICCDGCPNVVHPKCVSLKTVPDEDWFCEECVLNQESQEHNGIRKLPFGRCVPFDDNEAESLLQLIQSLKEKRPEPKAKKSTRPMDSLADDEDSYLDKDDDDYFGDVEGDDSRDVPKKRKRNKTSEPVFPGNSDGPKPKIVYRDDIEEEVLSEPEAIPTSSRQQLRIGDAKPMSEISDSQTVKKQHKVVYRDDIEEEVLSENEILPVSSRRSLKAKSMRSKRSIKRRTQALGENDAVVSASKQDRKRTRKLMVSESNTNIRKGQPNRRKQSTRRSDRGHIPTDRYGYDGDYGSVPSRTSSRKRAVPRKLVAEEPADSDSMRPRKRRRPKKFDVDAENSAARRRVGQR